MQHYLGPDVRMWSLGFTASEAYIGTAFSPTDLSLFKATSDDIIEYLDMTGSETASNLSFAVRSFPAVRVPSRLLSHSTRSKLAIDMKSWSQPAMACGDTALATSSKSLALIRSMVVPFYATSNVAGTRFSIMSIGLRRLHDISTFVRVRTALISEEELASAVFSAQDVLGSITEFTVIVDERKVPSSLAFLVEIDGELCETVFFS